MGGGGGGATFLQEPKDFHERFVNARARRLHEKHFHAVRSLPEARLRNALLFAAYGDTRVVPPKRGCPAK
eukprot:85777-Alexandrium_andersonii.AAC.1